VKYEPTLLRKLQGPSCPSYVIKATVKPENRWQAAARVEMSREQIDREADQEPDSKPNRKAFCQGSFRTILRY
jgi:hypothetical protein